MWQEIIITDLTRMSEDKVCIAGLTHQNVVIRPDLPPPGIREQHLFSGTQVIIRPRAVINLLVEPKQNCKAPHLEDHEWRDTDQTQFLRLVDENTWRTVLDRTTSKSVESIFETPVHDNKKIAPGTGICSLGTIRPISIENVEYERDRWESKKYKYRLSFTDASHQKFVQLSITDLALRCFVDNLGMRQHLPFETIQKQLLDKLHHSTVWLRIGLTRPFDKDDSGKKWCYLQVNGIYTMPDYLSGACFADFK
jgi:hypothetical protein